MEHRMRYRDIPWGVALTVLPGKIIGTFIIKPIVWFKRNWRYRLRSWWRKFYTTLAVIGLVIAVALVTDRLTDGAFFGWLAAGWDWLMAL